MWSGHEQPDARARLRERLGNNDREEADDQARGKAHTGLQHLLGAATAKGDSTVWQ
eukprot:SAG31_NODE_5036_length_2787_cov_1.736979_1_plen_56_part_00